MKRRAGPWTIVCLVGFALYVVMGTLRWGTPRAIAFYGIALALLALAVLQLTRGRASKPPLP